jgi:lycopene elongase/hydratase (dihydrobisanhydrobacterioruberin-forming)
MKKDKKSIPNKVPKKIPKSGEKSKYFWILLLSRPRFWMYTFGPFLIGLVASQIISLMLHDYSLSFLFWLIFIGLYFLIGANYIIYGVNDFFDRDTDAFNEKKREKEYLFRNSHSRIVLCIIGLSAIWSVFTFLMLKSIESKILFILFLLLGIFYSMPPIRFKARPFFDSSSNIFYVFPGFIIYLELTQTSFFSISPFIILASFLWPIAMHLYSAIPDILADKRANLETTATKLGERNSVWICAIFWFLSALFAVFVSLWFIPLFLYTILPMLSRKNIAHFYWYFPIINLCSGMYIFLVTLFMF